MPQELIHAAVVAAAFLLGGLVKGVIGLGLPTIAMGILGTFMLPAQAAAVLVVPTLLTNVWQAWAGPGTLAVLKRMWPLMAGMLVGTLATSGIIAGPNVRLSIALLGCVLMFYTLVSLIGWRPRVSDRHAPVLTPLAGLTAGLINGATAIFVIPTAPYIQALPFDKTGFIKAFGLGGLAASLALVIGLGMHDGMTLDIAPYAALAIAIAFVGMWIGQKIRNYLDLDAFRRWVLIGQFLLGASMLVRVLV